jgi:hypothetical protein
MADRLGFARLGVAMQRRVLVRPQTEEHAAADLTKRQRLQERHGLRKKLLGLLGPSLPFAAVLVFPALVLEEMKAHVPREIDAMPVREETRLRLVERMIGLVAEPQGAQIAEATLQERARLVGQRTKLAKLVFRHRLDDVPVVGVAIGGRPRRGDPHPFQTAARRVRAGVDEAEGELVVERGERVAIHVRLEVDERPTPDAPKPVAAHGRLPRIFQRVTEGTSYGSPKQAAVTASAVSGASKIPLRWCPVA